jgi:hypothetical protein
LSELHRKSLSATQLFSEWLNAGFEFDNSIASSFAELPSLLLSASELKSPFFLLGEAKS